MRAGLRIGVVILLLVCAGLSGCAPEPYRAADQQQSGTCDGIPPPVSVELIAPGAGITDVAICEIPVVGEHAPSGSSRPAMVRVLPTARFPELLAGLTLPDGTGTVETCTAMLVVVTDFTVTLADGSRVRPGVPGDGCHPRDDALTAFAGLEAMAMRRERAARSSG